MRRIKRTWKLGGWYLIVLMFVAVAIIFIWALYKRAPLWYPVSLTFALVLWGVGSYIYIRHHNRPPATLEMNKDKVCLYEDDHLVCEIVFGHDVEVNLIHQSTIRSEEFGTLCGYSFQSGEDQILVTTRGDWDLWDIQEMRDPLFEVVDSHRMDQGPGMLRYRKAMAEKTG